MKIAQMLKPKMIPVEFCIIENGELHLVITKVDIGGCLAPFELESQYFPEDGEIFSYKDSVLSIGAREVTCPILQPGYHPNWYHGAMHLKDTVALLHCLQRNGFHCVHAASGIFSRFNRGDRFYKRTIRDYARTA